MNVAEFKKRVMEVTGCTEGIFRKSALSIRDGAGVFDKVLGGKQYKTILEIGTFRGIGAAYMAQFCDRLITIDLANGRLEQLGEKFDRHALWSGLGINNIELHLVEDGRGKASLINVLQFDFAFIDGGKHDVADDFDSVKRCGTVLFHDFDKRGNRAQDTVYNFVRSLPREQVTVMDIFALWRAP